MGGPACVSPQWPRGRGCPPLSRPSRRAHGRPWLVRNRKRISLSCERLRALLPPFDGRREDMASVLEMSVQFLRMAGALLPGGEQPVRVGRGCPTGEGGSGCLPPARPGWLLLPESPRCRSQSSHLLWAPHPGPRPARGASQERVPPPFPTPPARAEDRVCAQGGPGTGSPCFLWFPRDHVRGDFGVSFRVRSSAPRRRTGTSGS